VKNILVIDNYDSFVFNLVQLLGKLGTLPTVARNDQMTIEEIKSFEPDGIVISPGPGHPADKKSFGICTRIIKELGVYIPILGVCLGHQGIAHAYGGKVINSKKIKHGKTSLISYNDEKLFKYIHNPFSATRYHSLVADRHTFPSCLNITATSIDDFEIMGLEHKKYPIHGVQFHPESILTKQGHLIINNFISLLDK
jgi:anthranilate synthase component II